MLFSGARAAPALVADLENVAYVLLDLTLRVIAVPLTKAVWTSSTCTRSKCGNSC